MVRNPVALFAVTALQVVTYGSVRIATAPSRTQTVGVAGVTVEHPRDYWALRDLGTPKEEVDKFRPEPGSYFGRRATVCILLVIFLATLGIRNTARPN